MDNAIAYANRSPNTKQSQFVLAYLSIASASIANTALYSLQPLRSLGLLGLVIFV